MFGESGSILSGCINNGEFLFASEDGLWSVELTLCLIFGQTTPYFPECPVSLNKPHIQVFKK
jgi:hypothetical protein